MDYPCTLWTRNLRCGEKSYGAVTDPQTFAVLESDIDWLEMRTISPTLLNNMSTMRGRLGLGCDPFATARRRWANASRSPQSHDPLVLSRPVSIHQSRLLHHVSKHYAAAAELHFLRCSSALWEQLRGSCHRVVTPSPSWKNHRLEGVRGTPPP